MKQTKIKAKVTDSKLKAQNRSRAQKPSSSVTRAKHGITSLKATKASSEITKPIIKSSAIKSLSKDSDGKTEQSSHAATTKGNTRLQLPGEPSIQDNKSAVAEPAKHPKARKNNWPKGKSANPATQWSSTKQPSKEAKLMGRMRQLAGQKLAQELLVMTFKGVPGSDMAEKIRQYFGLPPGTEVGVEAMMHLRQIEKAISKADTAAYRAALERAHGMPNQLSKHIFEDGAVVKIGGKKLE